jgi:2'-5' RNA ligase
MSARLFVAVDLPAQVREALAGWAREAAVAQPLLDALRLVPAGNLHVTLVFLGAREEGDIPALADLVTARAPGPVPLALGGPLWLAPRRPHVLTLALEDPEGALGRLHGAMTEALRAGVGHRPEGRALRPHVTVARVRRGARVRPESVALPDPPRLAFAAPALTLYRSRLGPGGSRYEPLARVAAG